VLVDAKYQGRDRKLLLHANEIAKIRVKIEAKGYTLVPLKLYIRDGMAKLELGVGKGKKAYDKRRTIAERDARREIERATKERVRM